MADTAAHLVDAVFPEEPVRQWVLTVPVALRYRMAFDAGLTAEVLRAFARAVFASLRRRARERRKIRYAHAGAVTFIQRFGDALNLNVHFHLLALDGVFDADDPESIRFVPLDPPDDAEVLRVALTFARRLARHLERRGLGAEADPDDADSLMRDQPLMAELYGASVRGRVATGPRAGQRVRRLGDRIDIEHLLNVGSPGCASVGGISLHAAVAVPARDRRRLERLCRYAGPVHARSGRDPIARRHPRHTRMPRPAGAPATRGARGARRSSARRPLDRRSALHLPRPWWDRCARARPRSARLGGEQFEFTRAPGTRTAYIESGWWYVGGDRQVDRTLH